ncbi:hypothetical protein C8J56DRAFT_78058 [Mycena floridula]|nr:hypothetical protein C8J56DRAFT_78058 [Mycena floridula]
MPEPASQLPDAYRAQGVSIGDLGSINDDGGFDYLFNICHPPDHPINADGTPDDFEYLTLKRRDIRVNQTMHKHNTDITSLQIRKTQLSVEGDLRHLPQGFCEGFEFQTSSTEGAILMLPEGASRNNLLAQKKFHDHAVKHAVSWYRYVNETLEQVPRNGSLYLITGRDNAKSWGVTSFSDHEAGSVSLKFISTQDASGSGNMSYSWETQNSIPKRTGACENGHQSQCVFLRGIKIALRKSLFAKHFLGPVELSDILDSKPEDFGRPSDYRSWGPWPPPSQSSSNGQSGGSRSNGGGATDLEEGPTESEADVLLEPISEECRIYHPSDVINDFLLSKYPTADISTVHDEEWMALVNDDDVCFPSDEELLDRLQKVYDVVENGGALELARRPGILGISTPSGTHLIGTDADGNKFRPSVDLDVPAPKAEVRQPSPVESLSTQLPRLSVDTQLHRRPQSVDESPADGTFLAPRISSRPRRHSDNGLFARGANQRGSLNAPQSPRLSVNTTEVLSPVGVTISFSPVSSQGSLRDEDDDLGEPYQTWLQENKPDETWNVHMHRHHESSDSSSFLPSSPPSSFGDSSGFPSPGSQRSRASSSISSVRRGSESNISIVERRYSDSTDGHSPRSDRSFSRFSPSPELFHGELLLQPSPPRPSAAELHEAFNRSEETENSPIETTTALHCSSEGCRAIFTNKADLLRHTASHRGPRQTRCIHCRREFGSSYILTRHLRNKCNGTKKPKGRSKPSKA